MKSNQEQPAVSISRPLACALILLGAASRLMPHPPNMTSVGAVGLYSGARLRWWQAYLLPLLCMLVTDPILGFTMGFRPFSWGTPVIYGSLLVNVWLGRRLRGTEDPLRIGVASVLCSTQFFLVTNFAVWAGGSMYAHTSSGLLACFIAAIPFFGYTAAGDLLYSSTLFGLHAILSRKAFPAERVRAADMVSA